MNDMELKFNFKKFVFTTLKIFYIINLLFFFIASIANPELIYVVLALLIISIGILMWIQIGRWYKNIVIDQMMIESETKPKPSHTTNKPKPQRRFLVRR